MLLPLSWMVFPHSGLGQQQMRFGAPIQQQRTTARFIEPPRGLRQQLRDAEEAIEEKRYSDAIVTLGDLLERSMDPSDERAVAGQDYFLDEKDGLQQSFLKRCRELLGSLPEPAHATYELRYGALAEKLSQEAVQTRDWEKLREVRRRYFHTSAGYRASVLLAQHELAQGHPLAASFLLDDLVDTPVAVAILGDGVIAMHRVACRLADRSLPRTNPNQVVSVQVGEGDESAFESVSTWRTWIDEHYQIAADDSVSRSPDYKMLGGTLARNGTSEGQMPITSPRWMLENTATPLEEEKLRKAEDELLAGGRLMPPSWTPLRIGDQLLMRTTSRLRGVNYRTGKRIWQYPFAEMEPFDEEPITLGQVPEDVSARLTRKVWNDLPYGQMTSDGERVFLLKDLARSQFLQVSGWAGIRNARPSETGKNTLVALELETEGKILWQVGQDPTVESELNEAFFLSPPIAVEGALYAMVELTGDILLVCLDPATGKLRWKQQLLAIENLGIGNDPIRRVSGAMPSYHEGVLICPTGAGATVAVDLADRMLRWGNTYRRRSSDTRSFGSTVNDNREELFARWHSAVAVAVGTKVLVTPVVADNLYGFDLTTGKRLFNPARDGALYLAGVRDDAFFIVGEKRVSSYSLETGRLNWRSEPELFNMSQQVAGRGVFGKNSYFLPTSSNEILQLSLKDGSLISKRRTRFPLGNLIAIDGEMISQGVTHLAVAYGSESLGPRVDRLLAEDPTNLDALIQKAQLLIEQGKRSESLTLLDQAREIDEDNDEVLLLSIQSMLGELRENASPPEGLEEKLDLLIDTPDQRLEFLALRIQSALRRSETVAAMDRIIEFSRQLEKQRQLQNQDEVILRDPNRRCDLDNWLAARVAEMLRQVESEEEQDQIQSKLVERFQILRSSSSKSLESFIRQFKPMQLSELQIVLADRKLSEGDSLSAERLLLGRGALTEWLNSDQGGSAVDELLAERLLKLSSLYQEEKLPENARQLAEYLRDSASDLPPSLIDDANTVALNAESSIDSPNVDGNIGVSLTWEAQQVGGGRANNITMLFPAIQSGQSFSDWKIVNRASTVILQTPFGSPMTLPIQGGFRQRRQTDREMILSGGLMLIQRPGELMALDLLALAQKRLGDTIRWTRDFGSEESVVSSRSTENTIFGDAITSYRVGSNQEEFRVGTVQGDQMYVLLAGDLLALDPASGETLWRNSEAPTLGYTIADNDRVAVVSFGRALLEQVFEPTISIFDRYDGRLIESRPWRYGKPWATSGKNLVCYKAADDESSANIKLVDPLADEVLLELDDAAVRIPKREGRPRGYGRILQQRWMVLFDSLGNLTVWDLLRGVEVCRKQVEPLEDLTSMHAMLMQDQVLVLPARNYKRGKGSYTTQHGDAHKTTSRIYAVSTKTGEISWKKEFDPPWGVSIDQPASCPVVLLVRSMVDRTTEISSPRMDVMMLRVSDGKMLHEEYDHQVSPTSIGPTTFVVYEPLLDRIRVRIAGEDLRYRILPESAAATLEGDADGTPVDSDSIEDEDNDPDE
ncbi:MAG: PQQ-binding-like beta-propeller repeat protein [Planctomycetota bacterium]